MLTEIALIVLGIWLFVYLVDQLDQDKRRTATLLSLFGVGLKLVWDLGMVYVGL